MTLRRRVLLIVAFFTSISPCFSQSSFEEAISPAELAAMGNSLAGQRIYSLHLFREQKNDRLSAAFLVAYEGKGWQVLVVSPTAAHGYHIGWKSAELTDAFAVSSPENLGTYGLGNEEAVTFSGCAAHQCPDMFSVMLYVPSLHHAFIATCENGQTSYSFARTPEGAEYIQALNELLRKMVGSAQACSPDIREKR